jgi:hypothetical protein
MQDAKAGAKVGGLKKLAWAAIIVAFILPLGIAVRLPGARGGVGVDVAKGRPFVPVAQEQQGVDDAARDLALRDARVTGLLGQDRWEFIGTLGLSGYLPGALAGCAGQVCRQAQFYNYTRATLVVATVDLSGQRVLDVVEHAGAVPEASRAVTERAQAIALADARVQAEIGTGEIEANMAPENAWLRGSSCDTPHWCIALTYRVSDRASTLVVFVDLNAGQVAGVRWSVAPPVPEQNLPRYNQPDYVCGDPFSYSAKGWELSYEVQDNDALHVWNATFNGQPVFQSAKMTQVDVGYANQTWGYHDSVGCFGIVPPYPDNTPPTIIQAEDAFTLTQDFRMGGWGGGCAYRYQQWVVAAATTACTRPTCASTSARAAR